MCDAYHGAVEVAAITCAGQVVVEGHEAGVGPAGKQRPACLMKAGQRAQAACAAVPAARRPSGHALQQPAQQGAQQDSQLYSKAAGARPSVAAPACEGRRAVHDSHLNRCSSLGSMAGSARSKSSCRNTTCCGSLW